ncbi:uncharacterized protein LOC118242271 isoform X2 [Electrophorus electricus]|uniref:uncharacterized protein LOC118242271 isoform X2 n=1 Tax=Electrophorus electricus TaxID=8005 RepID=UPI0015D0C60B|nr:uncharacterized protein LOC118242271 isoform X2 [Electrophorus electricus]
MDALFYAVLVLLRLSASRGFLIAHAKGVCLSVRSGEVVLQKCDAASPLQQWTWTADMQLAHRQHGCLWADTSGALPPHARIVKLKECSGAPAWKCYDRRGTFGLAELPLYLKKQGAQAVVRVDPKYSNWTMYTVSSQGKAVLSFLCQSAGLPTVSTSKTSAQITTVRIPVTTDHGPGTSTGHTSNTRTKRTGTTNPAGPSVALALNTRVVLRKDKSSHTVPSGLLTTGHVSTERQEAASDSSVTQLPWELRNEMSNVTRMVFTDLHQTRNTHENFRLDPRWTPESISRTHNLRVSRNAVTASHTSVTDPETVFSVTSFRAPAVMRSTQRSTQSSTQPSGSLKTLSGTILDPSTDSSAEILSVSDTRTDVETAPLSAYTASAPTVVRDTKAFGTLRPLTGRSGFSKQLL